MICSTCMHACMKGQSFRSHTCAMAHILSSSSAALHQKSIHNPKLTSGHSDLGPCGAESCAAQTCPVEPYFMKQMRVESCRYVHRVGRTGRLAADGHALSFLTRNMAPLAAPLLELLQACARTAGLSRVSVPLAPSPCYFIRLGGLHSALNLACLAATAS